MRWLRRSRRHLPEIGDLLSLEDWVWTSAFRITAGMLKKQRGSGHTMPESGYELPEWSEIS